ncbi:MAG: hypothetical protein DHS20C02_10380 [Micavibrio sp.]|nr:MAG: hypothetical protein DHS20C02_10380 [Micavibrio sp.]
MKLTAEEFLAQPQKAITLIGMSGVGKSYLADKMAGWGWISYSCDDLISTKYLKNEFEGGDVDAMDALSRFVGRIGNSEKGGLVREEFKRRQQLYYDAECQALRDMLAVLEEAHGQQNSFINDSAGSLCEIEDTELIASIGKKTLFVYLKVGQEDYKGLLQRAFEHPKPLYFPPDFFRERLAHYMSDLDVSSVEDVDPDEFLRWVFPYLFESRLPKYKVLAEQYGVKVHVSDLENINSEDAFLSVVANALEVQQG